SGIPTARARAPPLETVAAEDVPKPLLLSTRTVPPELTCAAPVNVFAAERVNVPAQAIVKLPPPLIMPLAVVLPAPLNVRPKLLAVVPIAPPSVRPSPEAAEAELIVVAAVKVI